MIFAFCGCDTGTRYQFATYNDAKLDRTVLGASLPEFMPASARDINGWYHVEMNEETVEFTFSASDKTAMIFSFSPVSDPKSVCMNEGLMSRRWSDVSKSDKFEFYSRTANKLTECLGIDTDRWRAYYWALPRR
jgi:hypothetical protein